MQTETAEVAGDVVKDHLGTGRKRCVVLTLSKDENPKTLVMLFPGAATQPTVVLKIGLTPTSAAAVRSEGAALDGRCARSHSVGGDGPWKPGRCAVAASW